MARREGGDQGRRRAQGAARAARRSRPNAPSAKRTCSAPRNCATATSRRSNGASRSANAASARARRRRPQAPPVFLKEEVDADDVAEVVARWTGIPVNRMLEGESEKLVHMEERLHERVIGQDEAIEAVATALRRSRAGLQDPEPPDRLFLFLGPTGVGKTELARALAEFMFDSQDAMVRIDMSEYMEKHCRLAPGRRAARLRRLRRGRPAHRGRAPPPLLGRAARRDREGAPGRLQHAAAGDGRRAPDRRPGPHRRLQEHGADHDHATSRSTSRRSRRPAAQRTGRPLQTRVHQPPRRRRPVPAAQPRAARGDRRGPGCAASIDRVARARRRGRAHRRRESSSGNLGYDPAYGARPLRRAIQKQLSTGSRSRS